MISGKPALFVMLNFIVLDFCEFSSRFWHKHIFFVKVIQINNYCEENLHGENKNEIGGSQVSTEKKKYCLSTCYSVPKFIERV